VKQEYLARVEAFKTKYEHAGIDGAYGARLEFGKLSMIEGIPLKEVITPKGTVYFAKSGDMTVNLRNYSSSAGETQARWIIDIIGNERIKMR